MFEHRKYHWLYFVLGICIAVILATLMGCEQADTTAGVEIERCPIGYPECVDVIIYPPIACCAAMMPECMACNDGCTVDVWLEKTCGINAVGAEYAYWDEGTNEPVWLCQAEIID